MKYNGNLNWLTNRTILYVLAGSRGYGTNTAESDYDYRGIAIPPEEYQLGFLKHFDQAEFKPDENSEAVVYDIQKFFKLAADANPNILDIINTDENDIVEIDDCGKLLIENRDLFLSQKVLHTYRGYAMAQLKRAKTHRRWLQNPPDHKPTRKEFDIERERGISSEQISAAIAAINNKINSWAIDYGDMDEASKIYIEEQISSFLSDITLEQKFQTAGRSLGFSDNFIEYLEKERLYKQALADFNQYEEWKINRNPKRAIMEDKLSYDGKNVMHLFRLMAMCREILIEGKVKVKRPDAKELLEIRNGKYTFNEIMTWAEKQDKELVEIAKESELPHSPDRNKLDELCVKIIKMRNK